MRNSFLIFISLFVFTSCIDLNDVSPVEDNELITRVVLNFEVINSESEIEIEEYGMEEDDDHDDDHNSSDSSNHQYLSFTWKDSNGDGILDFVDQVVLDHSLQYKLRIEFWDDTKIPAERISHEIEEAADFHLIKLKIDPIAIANHVAKDRDRKGNKLGLNNYFKPNGKGQGIINVVLYHQPPVSGQDIKDGESELGSIDADVKFDLKIE